MQVTDEAVECCRKCCCTDYIIKVSKIRITKRSDIPTNTPSWFSNWS